ncbi:MAG: hypothetical protein M3Z06_10235 [Actinomycetota bacterium]|nr:hypothetical protein [Actinomycetota bacterium]
MPELSRLPLVSGARIVQQVRQCDRGANSFCAIELVVVDPRYRTSLDLLTGEHQRLASLGWTSANAQIGEERAADSPGHKLRVTFATDSGDLKGIDLGWIHRSRQTALALSHALFAHSAALSLMLEEGPA